MNSSRTTRSRAVRYARYGGPEVLEVVERDTPEPGPGQVRLAVRAASVNPFDGKLRSGLLARTEAPEVPVVCGTDVAGVVEALGPGVDTLSVGDEVLGRASGGAYAEQAVAEAAELIPRPAGMSWEVAASLEVVVDTAYAVLERLDPRPGELLLVNGASGGIGTIAVQAALARGATVVGTAGAHHQDVVAALGAVPVPHGEGVADRVRSAVSTLAPDRAAGPGPVVDAVFDVAGRGPLADLVALAGGPARVVTVAHPDAAALGVAFGARRWVPGALAEAAGLIATGRMTAPRVTVYPLEQAARAQEDNRTGAVGGKLVLVP